MNIKKKQLEDAVYRTLCNQLSQNNTPVALMLCPLMVENCVDDKDNDVDDSCLEDCCRGTFVVQVKILQPSIDSEDSLVSIEVPMKIIGSFIVSDYDRSTKIFTAEVGNYQMQK